MNSGWQTYWQVKNIFQLFNKGLSAGQDSMKVYLQANLRLNAIWYSKAIPSTVPHLITRGKPQTFVKNIIYLFMSFYHYLPLSSAQSVPSSFASFTYASLLYNKEAHCLTCQNERKSWMPVIYGRSGLLSFSQCRNPVNLLVCKIVMTLLYLFNWQGS